MLPEHLPSKYRLAAILRIENKLKINKQTKGLSISAYIKLKTLKTWKSLRLRKHLSKVQNFCLEPHFSSLAILKTFTLEA